MNNFVLNNKLKPADRIIVPKSLLGMVQHHAVYLGQDYSGQDLIAENVYGKYVRVVTADQFFMANPIITRIVRFNGANYERRTAVERAIKLLGVPYDLINFNCEHFANYIQTGVSKSDQSNTGIFLFLLAVGALIITSIE